MKLSIDISDKMFDTFKKYGIMAFDHLDEYDKDKLAVAIANGTPYEDRPQGEWIPVSERLPEEYGEYLVTVCNELVVKDIYNPYKKKFNKGKYVTAWQPLPEPYKEGEEE